MSEYWTREESEGNAGEVAFVGESKLVVLEDHDTGRYVFGIDGTWSDDGAQNGQYDTPAQAKLRAIECMRMLWEMLDSLPGVFGQVVARDYGQLDVMEAELAPDPNQAWLFGPFDEHAPESVKRLTTEVTQ